MGKFLPGNKAAAGSTWSRRTPEKDERNAYIRECWATGHLAYKLAFRPVLARIRAKWMASRRISRKFLIMSSRRTGKSSLGLLILTERAIRNPGTDHLYVAPAKNKLGLYIDPIFRQVFDDCPVKLMPKFKPSKAIIVFPNGSRIILTGSNRDAYESAIRSFKLKTIFIDEAREIDDFKDMMESAALPAVFDSDGYIIISSTPGKVLDCELAKVQNDLQAIGAYHHNTVFECNYPPERIAEFERETCGKNCGKGTKHKPAWLREYMAEWVRDESILIIPEFKIKEHVNSPQKDRQLYPFYYKFEAMDQGGVHKTVVLFAYFRFGKTPSLIIDGEEVFTGTDVRVDIIAKRIKAREALCQFNNVFSRVADVNDRIALKSLNSMYGFDFHPVVKIYGENNTGSKGLKAMVDETRTWFVSSPASVAINPACKELIGALQNCIWNDSGKFAMSENYGHADAIAALIYLIRHCPTTCPFPNGMNFNPAGQFNEESLLGKIPDADMQALQESFGFLEGLQHRTY
jgi:hypothetical protein